MEDRNLPQGIGSPSEELEGLKAGLGQWCPVDMVRVGDGVDLYCCFGRITRASGKCKLPYELKTSTGLVVGQGAATWSDGGKDAVLDARMSVGDGVIYVGVQQDDGTGRRLMIKRAKDIGVFKKTVTVSKAMPLFKWDSSKIVDFDK